MTNTDTDTTTELYDVDVDVDVVATLAEDLPRQYVGVARAEVARDVSEHAIRVWLSDESHDRRLATSLGRRGWTFRYESESRETGLVEPAQF